VRVLAYADSLELSGAESSFVALVRALAARPGIELGAAVVPGGLATELAAAGIRLHRLPRVELRAGLGSLDPRLLVGARLAARSGRYDVALVNLPSAQAGTAGLQAGPPAVGFLHIPHSMAGAGFRLGPLRDRLARTRLRHARRLVVPAPSVRRHAIEAWGLPPDRVGWAPEMFREPAAVPRERARAALGLPADRALVGIVGRLSFKQKGHDVLLDALAQLRRGGADVDLVVAGSGSDLPRLTSLAAPLGLAAHVHLVGQLADPAPLYGAVDALAIPSLFEGLPLVALEALHLSLPGIASRVDGLADVWPPEWLVEPGDARALARSLLALLDADRQALRRTAAAHWERLAPTYGRGTVERFVSELELAWDSPRR
jgi:glycosyltransferase involved in cell wall biosynthesis